jgi:acetyltransferase-like isoleucine patch superfamily enzyme
MLVNKIRFKITQILHTLIVYPLRFIIYSFFGSRICWSSKIPNLTINWPNQLLIGKHCTMENGIVFKYDSICKPGPNIIIGNNVFIGNKCEFNITKRITIGNNCLIASGCKFIDHDHGIYDTERNIDEQNLISNDIKIKENVWIGSNCVILKGVCIGQGSVVGAGSVVTKSIPENQIWGGAPAKFIKCRIK